MEREVVDNTLEELRERLLRWDELCAQLRELYYRYLDLAAFRSVKCFFPGRRCKRSWKRQYDVGDLTLMWTYIANTAPLCNRLIRALAEVEYKIRKRALKSLEKYGGVERSADLNNGYEITHVYLKKPMYGYLALWDDKLYVIWGEFDGLPKNGQLRATEIERRVIDVIERYKHCEKLDAQIDEFKIDDEYKRLWLEVPLPKSVSELLGGKTKAPVALFRNLGWLLSDDKRTESGHSSGNLGQMAVRVLDWIAIAMYVEGALLDGPLTFKISVPRVTRTKYGINHKIEVRAIGTTAKTIQTAYERFGVMLGKSEEVIAHGYVVLSALKEEAFKREGLAYVVDDVGAWIAFSNTVDILVIGDGYTMLPGFRVTAKASHKATLEGKTTIARELAKALGGTVAGRLVMLESWHMRLLLPIPSTPVFEKTVKLYEALINYPAAALVEVNGITYLFAHDGGGKFTIGRRKGEKLQEFIVQLGLKARFKKNMLLLTYTQLKELAKYGVTVRLLNDMEKDKIKEMRPVSPAPNLDAVRRAIEEIARFAKISVGRSQGREYVNIALHDKSRLKDVITILKATGVRFTVHHQRGVIYVRERRSVESFRRIIPHIFHNPS